MSTERWQLAANIATAFGVILLVVQTFLATSALRSTNQQLELSRSIAKLDLLNRLRESAIEVEHQFDTALAKDALEIGEADCRTLKRTIEEAVRTEPDAFFSLLRHYEASYEAYRLGILDEEDWKQQCDSLLARSRICAVRVFWDEIGKPHSSPRFQRVYESCTNAIR